MAWRLPLIGLLLSGTAWSARAHDPAAAEASADSGPTAAAASTPVSSTQWTGVGEFGLAIARGNTRSDTANGKLAFAYEDPRWKHSLEGSVLRARGEVEAADGSRTLEPSANRYELGGSTGFKFNERSYLLGSLRFERDEFAGFERQTTLAASYGLDALKSERTSLSLEIGPGYRQAHILDDGDADGLIVRGSGELKHQLTATTELSNQLLVESGSANRFLQNDLGIALKVTDALKLKTAFQLRHNSEQTAGTVATDRLFTTNFVYGF